MISIALATYNGELYLREQLDSIASQTKLPDELVVSDDCSTDLTLNIVKNFAQNVNFPVKILNNKKQLGSTYNFELAIRACRGNIIFLCDQDDVWYPNKIAQLAECLENNEDAGAVFTDADVVDQNLNLLQSSLWERLQVKQQELTKIAANNEAFKALINRNIVTGATMAFRAKYIPEMMPIPKEWVHDAWIALIISLSSKLIPLHVSLIAYRQHNSNQIGAPVKGRNRGKRFYSIYYPRVRIYKSALKRLSKSSFINNQETKKKILQINDYINFFYVRSSLPNTRWKRLPIILNEFICFRYHRYGKGIKHVIKDLLHKVDEQ